MQVSAISLISNNGYNMTDNISYRNNRLNGRIEDTSFNSLTPSTSKPAPADKLPIVFDSINQWKNFCHHRILGGKLNIIA